jgi:hypothetical protein
MAALTLNFSDTLNAAESFAAPVARVLAFDDSVAFAEVLIKGYGLNVSETLRVYEEFRRGSHGVVSDMILMNTELSPAIFADLVDSGHAPGYENYRDFVQGNYDYESAAFRIIIDSVTSDRAALISLKASADVPDITDGGEATITNAATGFNIVFDRDFNVAPSSVNVTLKGGESVSLVPEYSSVTKTGMNVKLRDNTNALQTGTVSWGVKGH